MGRLTFLKSLAEVGAWIIEPKSLSSFKPDINTIAPGVIPSHITVNEENLKLPRL